LRFPLRQLACTAVSENFGLASFSILAFFIVNWIVFYLGGELRQIEVSAAVEDRAQPSY